MRDERIERGLRNFAATVRRGESGATGATRDGAGRNWDASQSNARGHFRNLTTQLVGMEDRFGVEEVAEYVDRLTELRKRAMACGLLTAEDVCRLEAAAVA